MREKPEKNEVMRKRWSSASVTITCEACPWWRIDQARVTSSTIGTRAIAGGAEICERSERRIKGNPYSQFPGFGTTCWKRSNGTQQNVLNHKMVNRETKKRIKINEVQKLDTHKIWKTLRKWARTLGTVWKAKNEVKRENYENDSYERAMH